MTDASSNWLGSINAQVDFYASAKGRRRTDPEFDWAWLDWFQNAGRRRGGLRRLKATVREHLVGARMPAQRRDGAWSQTWLNTNAHLLWGARTLLGDDLSRLQFDAMLVLRATDASKFYFPRVEFGDFLVVVGEKPFRHDGLPHTYLGLPLQIFDLQLHENSWSPQLTVVSTRAQINLLNGYRQYFVHRNGIDVSPRRGEIVLDCGACIGEVSMIFAGLVGGQGQVHLFDPVPLHARYCQLHASLNPSLAHVFHINSLAVGEASREVVGPRSDSAEIAPGGLVVDAFATTSLDDYAARRSLERIDMIKMDIEGAEMAALEGATGCIRKFKPRLAVSTYHKPEDLWEIPDKIMAQNGDYRLFFGHHSPIEWESVYYAVSAT